MNRCPRTVPPRVPPSTHRGELLAAGETAARRSTSAPTLCRLEGDLVHTDTRSPDDTVLERVGSRPVGRRLLPVGRGLQTYQLAERAPLVGSQVFEKPIALLFCKVHELLGQLIDPGTSVRVRRSMGPQRQWFVVGGSSAGGLQHAPYVRPASGSRLPPKGADPTHLDRRGKRGAGCRLDGRAQQRGAAHPGDLFCGREVQSIDGPLEPAIPAGFEPRCSASTLYDFVALPRRFDLTVRTESTDD